MSNITIIIIIFIQTAVDQAESHAGKLKLKGRNACMVVAEKNAKLMACCISLIGAFQLSSVQLYIIIPIIPIIIAIIAFYIIIVLIIKYNYYRLHAWTSFATHSSF